MIEIRKFKDDQGRVPFDLFMDSLTDARAKASMLARLKRLSLGNFGDWKSVGGGVYELRVNKGKGYRIYFGREGKAVVILLVGGSKSTQSKDIRLAQTLWKKIS